MLDQGGRCHPKCGHGWGDPEDEINALYARLGETPPSRLVHCKGCGVDGRANLAWIDNAWWCPKCPPISNHSTEENDMTTQTQSRWPDADQTSGSGGTGEFGDLATVRRFAEEVCALGEGSDFVQTIHACSGLKDMVRDLGGDMNKAAAALVDAAVAVARDGEALREQATQVAALAQDMSGA